MKNVLIIGNGFDIAHGLNSTFNEFKYFIVKNYICTEPDYYCDKCDYKKSEDIVELNCTIEEDIIPSINYWVDEEDTSINREDVLFILKVLNDVYYDWKDFEEMLAMIDFTDTMDNCFDVYDREGDVDFPKTHFNREEMSRNIMYVFRNLNYLFSEWIESLDINKCKHIDKLRLIVDKKDFCCLNFNYTTLLENLYNVSKNKVCHIHGVAGDTKLIFGHNKILTEEQTERIYYNGTDPADSYIYNELKKNTDACIEKHSCFFESLKMDGIDNIYSFGFSFSDVDMAYIRKICKITDTKNTTWYIDDFNISKQPHYEEKIKNNGFLGSFSNFSI